MYYLTQVFKFFDRLIVSVAWIAHIIIYLLIDPPLSSFLNEVFIKLDDVWGMFDIGVHILYIIFSTYYISSPQPCIVTDLLCC